MKYLGRVWRPIGERGLLGPAEEVVVVVVGAMAVGATEGLVMGVVMAVAIAVVMGVAVMAEPVAALLGLLLVGAAESQHHQQQQPVDGVAEPSPRDLATVPAPMPPQRSA